MRRRYIVRDGKLVEIPLEQELTPRVQIQTGNHYEGLRTLEGEDISSAKKHREYMKRNDLALTSDFKEQWAKAAEERERTARGVSEWDKKARREDLAKVLYQKFKP